MKRFSAYATTILSIATLAAAGCQKHDDQGMQPGASNPAAPASTPAAAPPAPAPSHTSPNLAPPSTSPNATPAPATTAAH